MNIKLNYLYHDWANYKNYNELVFSNPENIDLEHAENIILQKLLDDTWFYAGSWGLKDMHFEKWDDEFDHAFHEFESIEYTGEPPTEEQTFKKFLEKIPDFKP